MGQRNIKGSLSLRGFRKLRTGAIVATGVILLGLGFLTPTVSANEQDGVWVARTVAEVKADIQNMNGLSYYTIQWGDTLSAISGATGLSVDSLVEINRIANRDLIFANNKLYFSEEAFRQEGNTKVRTQRVTVDNSSSCQSYEVETKTDTVTGDQTTTVREITPVVVEEPISPAPKAEDPAAPAPKSKAPVVSTPKSGESVELAPSTVASSIGHLEESEKPSPAPAVGSTVEQPSDTSFAPSAPKAEETTGTTGNTAISPQSAGETGTAESRPSTSNNPSTSATNEVSNAGESTPGTDNAPSSAETTDQPVASKPSSEAPAPKAEAPAPSNKPATEENGDTSTPVNPKDEASTSENPNTEKKSEEELKKEEELKSAKADSINDNIMEVYNSKLEAINKLSDENKKHELKAELEVLKLAAIEAIKNAKNEEEVVEIADDYQGRIYEIEVPGEEVSSPNYGKEGLTNKGPGGTTIDNGSTAIGHGASGTSRRSVSSPANRSA